MGLLIILLWGVWLIFHVRLTDWLNFRRILENFQGPKDKVFEGKVDEVLCRRRLERVRLIINNSNLIGAPILGALILGAKGNPALFVRFLAGEITIVTLAFFFFSFFPSQLTLRRVSVLLALCFTVIGVHPCTAPNSTTYYFVSFGGYAFQILFAQMLGDLRPLMLPILVVAAAHTYTVASTALFTQPTASGTFSLGTVMAGVAFMLITALPTQLSLREQARQEVLQGEAAKGEATAKSLLSAMCDAVIKLKSDLTLSNPSPPLEALLLRTSTFTRGACWYFPSCVLEGEIARVKDFLNHNNGEARSFHTTLVDALGTKVPVQLFHSPMTEMDGTMSHLLGILEDSKEGFQQHRSVAAAPGPEDGAARATFKSTTSEEEKMQRAETASLHSAGSAASSRFQEISISSWAGTGSGPFTVDLALSLKAQVWSESEHSRLLFGFGDAGQDSFLSRFAENDLFLEWLDSLFCEGRKTDKLFEGIESTNPVNLGNVKVFNPRNASYYHAEIVATCLESRPRAGKDQVSERLVRLQLKEIRIRKENDNKAVQRLLNQARGKHRKRNRAARSAALGDSLGSGTTAL